MPATNNLADSYSLGKFTPCSKIDLDYLTIASPHAITGECPRGRFVQRCALVVSQFPTDTARVFLNMLWGVGDRSSLRKFQGVIAPTQWRPEQAFSLALSQCE